MHPMTRKTARLDRRPHTPLVGQPGRLRNLFGPAAFSPATIPRRRAMPDTSKIKEHMDVISSDRKTVGQVDHLDGPDKIKLTKRSSPDGQHHHFIPTDWVDHVDQH